MPKFERETKEQEKPILLLFGTSSNPLFELLIEQYQDECKLAIITEGYHTSLATSISIIAPSSSYLVDKLVEKIEYAVLLLENRSDKKYLTHLLAKFEKDATKVALVIPLKNRREFYDVMADFKKKTNIFFLLLGDLFGENVSNGSSTTSKIIGKAITTKTLTLTGNDLFPIFPISQNDAITGINHILFGSKKKNNFYYLFYKHPQTILSAVHLLKRIEPELEVKYEQEEKEGQEIQESHEKIDEEIQSNLRIVPDFLDSALLGFEKSVKLLEGKPLERQEKEEKIFDQPVRARRFTFLLTALLVSLLLFIIIHTLLFFTASLLYNATVSSLNKGDYKGAFARLSKIDVLLRLGDPSMSALASFSPVYTDKLQEKVMLIDTVHELNLLATRDLRTAKKIQSGITESELRSLLSDLTFIYFEAQKFATEKSVLRKKLEESKYSKLLSLSYVLPEALGFGKEKNYLILFQNNGELRPNGGFVGSIGELKLIDGRVKEFLIHDVYDLDGQLKAHVEPQYIVRRYLQPHLYLRDSTFSLNFERSASTAALLYNLSTSKQVDGVVGVDFEVLRQVVGKIGPIKLHGYEKMLDEENLFKFLQEQIEANKFAGSTQKKDLLTEVFNELSLKLEQNPSLFYKIIGLIPQLLEEKHILFAFSNTASQQIFSVNGFSGNNRDLRDKKENELHDVLVINEANIGVNKANINIERNVIYDVFLTDEKQVTSKVGLTINNNKPDSVDYKAYIRVVTPLSSSLSAIKIDGKEQKIVPAVTDFKLYEAKNFKLPAGLEVDTIVEDQKQVFGFVTTVPKDTTQTIEVSYKNGIIPVSSSVLNYSLLYFKQPGTLEYPLKVRIHYKEGYSPQEVTNASFEGNTVVIDEKIKSDKEFTVKLLKR